jgi:hypothetical protein
MKSIKKIMLICTLAILLSPSLMAQKKVAVVTFYVDKQVSFDQIGGGAALVAAIGSLSEDENFDLTPVLNNFHETFFNEYAQQFPFELIPEEEVTQNPEYMAYESKHGETEDEDRNKLFQRYTTYEGYKPMGATLLKKNSNEAAMLEIFKEVDGVMLVNIEYAFVKKMVPFTAGVSAYVSIKLYNREGDKVFKIREFATSKESVGIVGGIPVMSPEKLLPLCENATQEVVEDLAKRLKKIAAKADKKL